MPVRATRGMAVVMASVVAVMSRSPAHAQSESPAQMQIAALTCLVENQTRQISQLRSQNAELTARLDAYQSAVAMASNGPRARRSAAESPSSALDWDSALRVAKAATLMVDGARLLTVMPTGSMEPIFDERAVLLTEPAPYDQLNVGDIITYRSSRYGLVVVHRILEKHGDKFWAKGDNNGRMDPDYVTRDNYVARVFGIIYAREPSDQARRFAEAAAYR